MMVRTVSVAAALLMLAWVAPTASESMFGFGVPGFGGGGGESREVDIGRIFSSGRKAFGSVSEEEEAKVGREAASVLLGAVPLLDNPPLQRYINRVGRWVAMHTERPGLKWRFGILDTDDINAFAAPGGYVFITKGLLLSMESEAELVGVLAHEAAHVLKKHHLAAVQKNARVDLAGALASIAADDADRGAVNRLTNGLSELYARGLDKSDEYEADEMGVVIAARAGYDPFGLPVVLQTLAAIDPDDSSIAFMFETHPHPNDRLDELDDDLVELDPYADQPQFRDRFRKQLTAAN